MKKNLKRLIAKSIAAAVLIAYSTPAHAFSPASYAGNGAGSTAAWQTDDDDDDMSGGALAVLLLAVGGAVAGVLYANDNYSQGSAMPQTVSFDKTAAEAVKVTLDGTDREGKRTRSQWTSRLDRSSGAIKVTADGGSRLMSRTRTEWAGKVDGSFYPVKGRRTSDEWSYTRIDARTLAFSSKKAGRASISGRIAVSANGRSFTISTNGVNSKGRRVKKEATYAMRGT